MKIYQGMKHIVLLAAALFLGALALPAQNQNQAQTPEQKEKQMLEYIDREVKRLSEQLELEYWQEFYVDSTLTHDYKALQDELEELQKTKVGNVDKYWKASGQRAQKARDKRKAKVEKATAELKNEGK